MQNSDVVQNATNRKGEQNSAKAPERCPFYKGDRVEYTDPKTKQVVTGTVKTTGLLRDRISVTTDLHFVIKWGWRNFRPTKIPAPVVQRIPNPFCKGDRVEWTYKGKVEYGTVKSVRDERVTVDMDSQYAVFRCNHTTLKPTTVQRAVGGLTRTDPPMLIDAFTVTGYKSTGGEEGDGYRASLVFKGQRVGTIVNQGYGGETDIEIKEPSMRKEFETCLKQAWTINGGKEADYGGAESFVDIWAFWVAYDKPRGKWLYEHVEEMQAFSDKCNADRVKVEP